MIDRTHIQSFYACKKITPSEKDIKSLISDINYKFIPLINFLKNGHGITDTKNLKNSITNMIQYFFEDYSKSKYIDSRLYELQEINYILKNPSVIDTLYNRVKDQPNTHTVYNANSARSQKLVLVSALDEISQIEGFAKEHEITENTKLENIVFTGDNRKEKKHFIKMTIDILKSNSIKNKVLVFLEYQKEQCIEFIRKNQISSLNAIHTHLASCGLLEDDINAYTNNCKKFGLSELDVFSSENSSFNSKQLFSEDTLSSLSVEDLCFYNAFWCNRYAKACSHFTSAFCTINSLDLWQEILEGKKHFNISNEALTASLQKSWLINKLINDTFSMYQNQLSNAEIKQGNTVEYSFTKDYTSYYTQLHNYINKDYCDYFSNYLPGNNDFMDDVVFLAPFANLEGFAYRKKDTTLEPLIKDMLNNNHYCKNWGIIRNEIIDGKCIDSIDENKSKVLLGFDIKGFNTRFCFHYKKNNLMDLIKLCNANCMIPEYQGYEDFIINNEVIPSNIIMPVAKQQRIAIMQNVKKDGPYKKLWEHLYFLMNGKLPKHFTETVQKSKKETITTRLPICYTDLRTGKRFVKQNEEFIEVGDSNVR